MEIDLSAVIVKIVSRAIMDSNKNVVCLIKEAISAIKFDGSLSSDSENRKRKHKGGHTNVLMKQ